MKLEHFLLKLYNKEDNIHNQIIDKIQKDDLNNEYLGNIYSMINKIEKRKEDDFLHNNTYIVYYNDKPIGYISLTHNNDDYEIIAGLIPEERNKHLGSLLLKEFTHSIFNEYKRIDKLTLKIDDKNIGSIKSALNVGYIKENNKYINRR